MASTTVVALLSSAITQVGNTFAGLLPTIVPVAIVLAILFGIVHWLFSSSRRY